MSVDTDELAVMVKACDRGALLRGSAEIVVSETEQEARRLARRSLVLERDLRAGAILALDDIAMKRPGTGIEPHAIDAVLGAKLLLDAPRDHVLQWADIEVR
jgi:sialic acid synthase SpsE